MDVVDTDEEYKDTVREVIRNGSSLGFDFIFMNTMATIIACYGLFSNSPAVVIGAMIVAMLLGPILGSAMALVDSDVNLLKISLFTLISGIFGIMLTALFIGIVHSKIPLTNEIMARTAPNLMDLMIALAGGAAGAYATVAPRLSAAFVGVAIATALVPPLASTGILLARGAYDLASGAFLLAFTNIIAIQLSASAVMWFTGFRRVTYAIEENGLVIFIKNNVISAGVLILLATTLTGNLTHVVSKQLYENEVRELLVKEIKATSPYNSLAEVDIDDKDDITNIRATVSGLTALTTKQVRAIETRLPKPSADTETELKIRFVQTTITNRNGLEHEEEAIINANP